MPEKVEFEYTDKEKDEMALVISAIQTVREIKVEYSMKPSEDLTISLHNDNGYVALNTESTFSGHVSTFKLSFSCGKFK